MNEFGHQGQAGWLAQKIAVLEDPETPADKLEATMNELHHIVLGMGGLMDLRHRAPSTAEADSAREDLDTLADRLFELTR